MAKSKNLVRIGLKCTESGQINYTTTKNKKGNASKMEMMKYCPALRRHTLHREIKLK